MARPHGTPTWIDYSANGLAPSIALYERLTGWDIVDAGAAVEHYRLAHSPEGQVAGFMDTTGMQCPEGGGIPPSWDVFLAVDSVDETLRRATAAGGRVIVEPGDVPGQGRMAMLQDPTGCSVGIWEDRGFAGFPESTGPGSPVWFEIMSMDIEGTRRFYTDVFGFDYQAMPGPGDEPGYFTNASPETASSGLCDARSWFPEGTRSFWRWYLAVERTDAAITTVEELGGKVLDGPVDSPFGRVATIEDPAGATLQILDPSAGRSTDDDARIEQR